MNTALWIAAAVLACVALAAGAGKLLLPMEKLASAAGGGWTADAGPGFVRILGALEVLAAAGLTLPALPGALPVLVPVTAVCWVLLMAGAMATHIRRGDPLLFPAVNGAYLVLAAFLAWGRFFAVPL